MKIRLLKDSNQAVPPLCKGNVLVVRKRTDKGYYAKFERGDREYFIYLNEAEELNENNQS